MQLSINTPHDSQDRTVKKQLEDLDLFYLLKLEHLSPEEKQQQLERIHRIAFLHFINIDLPSQLPPEDIKELESMTQNIHDIDLNQVEDFLRNKLKNFSDKIIQKENSVKISVLIGHFEKELQHLELEQKMTGADYLVQILAVERILKAITFGDWDIVEATVDQTRTHTSYTHH